MSDSIRLRLAMIKAAKDEVEHAKNVKFGSTASLNKEQGGVIKHELALLDLLHELLSSGHRKNQARFRNHVAKHLDKMFAEYFGGSWLDSAAATERIIKEKLNIN